MTLRNRVALTAAAIVLVVLAGVSTVLLLFYAAQLRTGADAALMDAAQQATAIANSIKISQKTSASTAPQKQPESGGVTITLGVTQLELIMGSVSVGQPSAFGPLSARDVAVAQGSAPAYFADMSGQGKRRVYTAPLMDVPGGGLVRASSSPASFDDALRQAVLLLAGLVLAATLATYIALLLMAGRILRPIRHLTSAAEHITKTRDLSARLDIGTSGDEVTRLGSAFNTMLGALDESVAAQRQLVADASHELRTPLTSLTTNLDLLQDGQAMADPQAPELVAAARAQAGELNQLIADLLDLSRYQETAPHREIIRLDELAQETVDRVRQRLPRPNIELHAEPCLVSIDPAAVDRAITNLIDNAIKWSPPDSPVRVDVADGSVAVTDHGPGISDTDLPHVFERFYRAPAARGRPGTGLGLSIVANVASANGGSANVETSPSGSVFTLTFHDNQEES